MIDYLKDKKKNGFSLIELVMVMVILGIVASVAIPKMTNVLDKAELRAEQAVVNHIWAGCESYANDKLLEEGNETWPYHPLTIFGMTRNLKITLDLGLPNEDNEWQFDLTTVGEPAIFHRRKNNEIWYYTYDSTNFELSETLLSLLVSSFLLGDADTTDIDLDALWESTVCEEIEEINEIEGEVEQVTSVAGVRGAEAEDEALEHLYYRKSMKRLSQVELQKALGRLLKKKSTVTDSLTLSKIDSYIKQLKKKIKI